MSQHVSLNIVRQALNIRRLPVLLGKIIQRLTDRRQDKNSAEDLAWLAAHQQDFAEFASKLDSELWQASLDYADSLEQHADSVLSTLDVTLGGGGFYPMIYFVTRYLNPETIVESGVAAGYSSHAFLSALADNATDHLPGQNHQRESRGKLFSSDFPYFRLENPEQYIGILVPDSLKSRWSLFIDGDTKNLPAMMQQIRADKRKVELFHYDSDKRFAGREQAMATVQPHLAENAIVIMDDINDNNWFKTWCEKTNQPFFVFEFKGKYIGMVGDLRKAASTPLCS